MSKKSFYQCLNSSLFQGGSQDINLDFVRLPFQFSSGGHQSNPSQSGGSSGGGGPGYFSQYTDVRPSFPDDTKKNVMDSARQTLFVEKLLPYVKQYAYTWFHLQVRIAHNLGSVFYLHVPRSAWPWKRSSVRFPYDSVNMLISS